MKQTSPFTRMNEQPEFPTWKAPKVGFLGTVVGILMWIGLVIFFLFIAYTQLFTTNLVYLLQQVKPGAYKVPFLFSAIVVLLLFPVSLVIILLGTFVKIIRSA